MQEKEQKKGKKILRTFGKFIFYSFVMCLVILFCAGGVGLGLFAALLKNEKVMTKADYDKELQGWHQTSFAYFRDISTGEPVPIGKMHSELDRQMVNSLDDVSPYLVKAFLGIEDYSFYEHKGVVPRSIARALYENLTGQKGSTGGSTITQQLVKNEIIDNREQTYERKAKDIVHAIRIERYYKKEEIFVKYMNSAYFFKGANKKHLYGVSAAASGIFNKNVKDLNLPEAAYIAGMVQRPNAYTPFKEESLQLGIKRMKLVLEQMKKFGLITEKEYQEAITYDIASALAKPENFTNAYEQYPFIITAIEMEAKNIFREIDKKNGVKGKTNKDYHEQVTKGGYHFYTSLDRTLYDNMTKAADQIDRPKRTRKLKSGKKITVEEQIGAVMVDNKTGEILSFYAGKDFDKNQEDHAFDTKNQPGSTMKPLLAYGPALNEGIISPSSIIIDEPLPKRGGSGVYRNADGKYHGAVSATDALKKSYNIPPVKIYRSLQRKIGSKKLNEYITRMGVPPHQKDGEALVLGGATYGYTVAQMTGAFSMIANYGTYIKPHMITKIVDSQGNVVYDATRDIKPDQIFKPQVAFQLQQMLRQVVTNGTGTKIAAGTGGYNVIGKTGTTSSQEDLWFIGSTPEITMGVWSGYDYGKLRVTDNVNKVAWVRLFQAAVKSRPTLMKKGNAFQNPGGALKEQCYECNKKVPPTQTPNSEQPSSETEEAEE